MHDNNSTHINKKSVTQFSIKVLLIAINFTKIKVSNSFLFTEHFVVNKDCCLIYELCTCRRTYKSCCLSSSYESHWVQSPSFYQHTPCTTCYVFLVQLAGTRIFCDIDTLLPGKTSW